MRTAPALTLTAAKRAITAVLLSLATACAQTQSFDASGYRIFEMRSDLVRPIRPTGDHNIAWLDEERVLFEGWDRVLKDRQAPDREPGAWHGLYIWNVRTGEVTRYSSDPLRSNMCFAEGYISYVVSRGGQQIRLEGPIGKEGPLPILMNGGSRDRQVNRFTCKSFRRSQLPRSLVGGGIEPLRPEHGWLEYTGSATWLRSPSGDLTLLTDEGLRTGTVSPQKYSFATEAYVFWEPFQDKTWLVTATGRVIHQSPPAAKAAGGRVEPAGLEIMLWRARGLNVRARWDAGNAGLYVYQSGPPVRILRGLVDALIVNPGGCLVAAIVDPWNRENREYELRAINVCDREVVRVGK